MAEESRLLTLAQAQTDTPTAHTFFEKVEASFCHTRHFSLVTKHHRHHNADSTRYLLWPTMSIYFFNFPFHSPYVCVLMLSRTFSSERRWIDGDVRIEWRVNKTTTTSHRFRSIGLGEKFCSKLIGNIFGDKLFMLCECDENCITTMTPDSSRLGYLWGQT